jgi:hypothetical protein
MSLLLVVARPGRHIDSGDTPQGPAPAAPAWTLLDAGRADPDSVAAAAVARTDVWRAVRDEVEELRGLDRLARAVADDPDDPTVTYAAHADEAVEAVERQIAAGAGAVAVVPVALAVDGPADGLCGPDFDDLHRRLEAIGEANPGVELQYVGPPFHHAPALEAAIAALRPPGSEEPALLSAAVERAFGGDLDRFGRFMRALQGGVPPGTRLALRGSAVQGASYKTGEPFDARGPGTSDLDVVLLGEEAMAAWSPDAFYVPGINTQPLDDKAPDIAGAELEQARRAAQAEAGRPVALQAMAGWFLDLRSGLQGTPYVVLGG